jgi:aminopeptidase N
MKGEKVKTGNYNCLEFLCTRCQQKLKVNTSAGLIDAVLKHYRHLHTSYDRERRKISRWLSREDVLAVTRGSFKGFGELLSYYLRHKKFLDENEKKYLENLLQTLRNLGTEKARKHYNAIALRLALKDLEMLRLTN